MAANWIQTPKRWAEKALKTTQSVANTPTALCIVFLTELTGCTLIPMPIELVLAALVTTVPKRWTKFAVSAALGSTVGGIVLYLVGRLLFESLGIHIVSMCGAGPQWDRVQSALNGGWGVPFLFVAYSTSGLFRIASIGAGVSRVSPVLFIALLILCRFVRFIIEVLAMKNLGERFRSGIRRYYIYASAVALLVFGIFFLGAKFVLR